MAKIDNIHQRIRLYLSKARSGYFSPEEIDEAVFIASKSLFNDLKGKYESNQEISDHLSPFKSDPTTLAVGINGQATKPSDYSYVSSITSGDNYVNVDIVDEAFRANRINDPICGPSSDYPIVTIYKTYFQFNPTNLTNVQLTYLKEPVKPRWGYIIVSNVPVFQESGGVTGDTIDIEWDEDVLNEIEAKTLSVLGVNLREESITQYGELKSNK